MSETVKQIVLGPGKTTYKTLNPAPKAPPPQFIAAQEAPPPPAFVVPKMSHMEQSSYVPKVRRVVEAEIEEIALRAQPLFNKRYPRMTKEGTIAWLRSIIYNNRWLFIRSAHAAGVAFCKQDVFEPLPVVVEFAVISWAPASGLGNGSVLIYREMLKWAEDLKAIEFWFGSANEFDLTPFAKRLGCETYNMQFVKKLR